jgi:hypothetical protein
MVRRTESFVPAIGMREHLGAYDSAVEPALHGDRLTLGDHHAILAARPCIDQRATAAILHHEFVAEDLGDVAPDRDRTSFDHLVDRSGLQQQHVSRLPILGEARAAGPERGTGDQHDGKSAGRDAAIGQPQAAPWRWQRFRFEGMLSVGHNTVFLVIVVDVRTGQGVAKSSLNRTVQAELS